MITRANSLFLTNKRVFAVPIKGAPSSIKCDDRGLVYAGCADGIEVWNSGGVLQAVIEVPGEFDGPKYPPFVHSLAPGNVLHSLTGDQEASPLSALVDATRRAARYSPVLNSNYGGCALAALEPQYYVSNELDGLSGMNVLPWSRRHTTDGSIDVEHK